MSKQVLELMEKTSSMSGDASISAFYSMDFSVWLIANVFHTWKMNSAALEISWRRCKILILKIWTFKNIRTHMYVITPQRHRVSFKSVTGQKETKWIFSIHKREGINRWENIYWNVSCCQVQKSALQEEKLKIRYMEGRSKQGLNIFFSWIS